MWRDLFERIRPVLPILRWLPQYETSDLRSDVMAGLTVGVMLIPQGMAYAVIAGLPPIYGLYAALAPPIVYAALGTSRQLSIGPLAIDMLIIAAGVGALAESGSERYIALAILLAAMAGLMQIGMGFIQFGFVADLLSRPVINGFTAAAALIISFSQLGNLLGIALPESQYVHILIRDALEQIGEVHFTSLALGLGGILIIVGLQRWKATFPSGLVVVVLGTVIAWSFDLEIEGVQVVGDVPQGLPLLEWPGLGASDLRGLLPTAITLALVQFMTIISLGRVFAKRHRYTIDANQELLAIGSANVVGSFFSSPPVSGSFSRSAVNDQAGARSPLANVITALLIGLTLLFLTPLLHYLPLPVLAAIIIVAATGLVDLSEVLTLFQIKRREGFIALFTFICTLVIGIQEGILFGVGASLFAVLYRLSRPNVAELGHIQGTREFRDRRRFPEAYPIAGVLVLRVDAAFSFTNAEFFKNFILSKSQQEGSAFRTVIVDGSSINDLDSTAVDALFSIIDELDERDIELHFTGLIGPVRDLMRRSDLRERLGKDHFHMNPHRAVMHVLRQWDKQDGGSRLARYLAATEAETEVPTGVS